MSDIRSVCGCATHSRCRRGPALRSNGQLSERRRACGWALGVAHCSTEPPGSPRAPVTRSDLAQGLSCFCPTRCESPGVAHNTNTMLRRVAAVPFNCQPIPGLSPAGSNGAPGLLRAVRCRRAGGCAPTGAESQQRHEMCARLPRLPRLPHHYTTHSATLNTKALSFVFF